MEYLKLKELQNEELKIAIEIDKFCNENDIKYFLSSGSLLGAIRHHGFIPWDDDMDMYMTREDYDRFCNIFSHPNLIIKYCENGTLHAPFAKVCNPNIIVESETLGDEDNSILWVDIFPIDGAAETKYEQEKRFKKVSFLSKLLMTNRSIYYPSKNPVKNIFKYLFDKLITKCLPEVLETIISPPFCFIERIVLFLKKYLVISSIFPPSFSPSIVSVLSGVEVFNRSIFLYFSSGIALITTFPSFSFILIFLYILELRCFLPIYFI